MPTRRASTPATLTSSGALVAHPALCEPLQAAAHCLRHTRPLSLPGLVRLLLSAAVAPAIRDTPRDTECNQRPGGADAMLQRQLEALWVHVHEYADPGEKSASTAYDKENVLGKKEQRVAAILHGLPPSRFPPYVLAELLHAFATHRMAAYPCYQDPATNDIIATEATLVLRHRTALTLQEVLLELEKELSEEEEPSQQQQQQRREMLDSCREIVEQLRCQHATERHCPHDSLVAGSAHVSTLPTTVTATSVRKVRLAASGLAIPRPRQTDAGEKTTVVADPATYNAAATTGGGLSSLDALNGLESRPAGHAVDRTQRLTHHPPAPTSSSSSSSAGSPSSSSTNTSAAGDRPKSHSSPHVSDTLATAAAEPGARVTTQTMARVSRWLDGAADPTTTTTAATVSLPMRKDKNGSSHPPVVAARPTVPFALSRGPTTRAAAASAAPPLPPPTTTATVAAAGAAAPRPLSYRLYRVTSDVLQREEMARHSAARHADVDSSSSSSSGGNNSSLDEDDDDDELALASTGSDTTSRSRSSGRASRRDYSSVASSQRGRSNGVRANRDGDGVGEGSAGKQQQHHSRHAAPQLVDDPRYQSPLNPILAGYTTTRPFRIDELGAATAAEIRSLPLYAQAHHMNLEASHRGRTCYLDPVTGCLTLTSVFLSRFSHCYGEYTTHCPHGELCRRHGDPDCLDDSSSEDSGGHGVWASWEEEDRRHTSLPLTVRDADDVDGDDDTDSDEVDGVGGKGRVGTFYAGSWSSGLAGVIVNAATVEELIGWGQARAAQRGRRAGPVPNALSWNEEDEEDEEDLARLEELEFLDYACL